LPPAACAASLEGLRLIQRQPSLRTKLWRNVRLLRDGLHRLGLSLPAEASPIIPIGVGEAKRAVQLSEGLLERGILVVAIRPPAVPRGTSRLRITVSAAHTSTEIAQLCHALESVLR
jgi:7-keto-8-aminopelargonate synthetase-like enzyme